LFEEKYSLKNLLFSKINRKITILFLTVTLLITLSCIATLYFIATENITNGFLINDINHLALITGIIIAFLAIGLAIIGIIISKIITKPLKKIHEATKEIKKGNYENLSIDLKNNDEIGRLAKAINQTTDALAKMDERKKLIDDAKTRFLTITSHELRSPMTPMKAQLQMLEQGYFGDLTDEQKDSLNMVVRNAERLDKIISDFLEISRIEAARLKFEFRKTDLTETVDELVKFMEGFAREKHVSLEKNIEPLPEIMVDPDRVSQVLRNLIHNAIKFSDEGGKIQISAEHRDDHILFTVKDHGTGMTPEDQIRVFEPFYQIDKASHKKYGGTGLGLAICRGIIESQKGKIWVESKLGKGSTFHFTVPLVPVRRIQPIKILFSQKGVIDKKIQDEFQTMLGPLGLGEFNDLKNKNALNRDEIFDFIDTLEERSILKPNQAITFKDKINCIFEGGSF
jgi:signal transduction histidine kinase